MHSSFQNGSVWKEIHMKLLIVVNRGAELRADRGEKGLSFYSIPFRWI